MTETVTVSRNDGIAIVTLNRPDYRNAQNSVMTYALDAAFEKAVEDDEGKGIVLAGNGTAWNLGQDMTMDATGQQFELRPYEASIDVTAGRLRVEQIGRNTAQRKKEDPRANACHRNLRRMDFAKT